MREKKAGNSVNSFSYPNDKEVILKELRIIAAREGKSQSEIIMGILEEYVKAHTSGNNTFKLDTWQEDPTFQAIPTLLADNKTWFPYLKDCTISERAKILKQANTIRSLAASSGPLK